MCVGDVVIDITAKVPALPERGGDVLAESGGVLPGGTGFNVMVAATRLGLHSAYGGAHGTGPFGDIARAALLREGIEILQAPVPEVDTGWDVALTDAGSERTFITSVGAEARLTDERIADIRVSEDDIVYVSGYGLLGEPNRSAITRWLATLPATATVVTDPGPLVGDIPRDVLLAVQARTTWWSCNLVEALAGTGATTAADAAVRLAAARMDTAGMGAVGMGVIVRSGADGCLLLAPGGGDPVHLPGHPVDAVDSNGAGDAHVGAFIAGIASGLPPVAAAQRANAAAAVAVTRNGPATGPTTAELDLFLTARPSP